MKQLGKPARRETVVGQSKIIQHASLGSTARLIKRGILSRKWEREHDDLSGAGAEPRKEPERRKGRMWCQRVESSIAEASASGIPNRMIEIEGEAALRARRCAQESRECARCAREKG